MAKLFDEDNVHDFWGLSPSIDILKLLESLPASIVQHSMLERLAQAEAIHLLQVFALCADQSRQVACIGA